MDEKLLPCPFCGSKAVLKVKEHIPHGYEFTPTCTNTSCAGRITKIWLSEGDALYAWNRRANIE